MTLYPRKQHMVVVGAGYAGLPLTLKLAKKLKSAGSEKLRLTLVNPEPHQELSCEFYRTLRDGSRASLPFLANLKKLGVDFIESRMTGISPKEHKITLGGARERSLNYDELVLACGAQPFIPNIEGLEPLSDEVRDRLFLFKTETQVQSLRLALRRLKWDPQTDFDRDRFVVILGAGTTGLEVAGEVAALRGNNRRARVILLDEAGEVLPGESPIARRFLLQELRKKNIEFILGSRATKMDGHEIWLENGQAIPWDLLVLCTGVRCKQPYLFEAFPQALDRDRGLITDGHFEIYGAPHHYAIGDLLSLSSASNSEFPNAVPGKKSAQIATKSGQFLADHVLENLNLRRRKTRETFEPSESGFFISVGPDFGIARLGPEPRSRLARTMSPFIWGKRAVELKRLNEIRYRKSVQWGRFI